MSNLLAMAAKKGRAMAWMAVSLLAPSRQLVFVLAACARHGLTEH